MQTRMNSVVALFVISGFLLVRGFPSDQMLKKSTLDVVVDDSSSSQETSINFGERWMKIADHYSELDSETVSAKQRRQTVSVEVPGYATVTGLIETSHFGKRPFSQFRGLFYGKKPNNLTRFLPPVPYRPDPDSVYDATQLGTMCTQSIIGRENCLLLTVNTPKLPGNASDPNTSYDDLLPVIFWIHGGSFSSGGNLLYSSKKYMDQNVVMVEVQYRLGPLGFLSLNTDEIPGNAGIFDQIEALRWTNQFIKYFGGDPNCVTIVGESAGSASVGLLLLAPQARGLFHRAIGQSGAMLTSWALDPDPVKHGLRIAELAGCPLKPYSELLHCLRNKRDRDLIRAFKRFQDEDQLQGGMGFGGSSPVIQVAGNERLLTEDPRKLMETGKYATEVPILFGANKHEGVMVLAAIYASFLVPHGYHENATYLENDLVPLIVKALGVNDSHGKIARKMTEKYLGYAEMGNFQSMVPGLIDLCGVLFLKEGGYETVNLHSKHNPKAYWYALNYEGRHSLYNVMFFPNIPPIPHGVNHADELIYLFAFPTLDHNATEAVLSRRMLQVWTTFAKHGDPAPDGVELLGGIPKFLPHNEKDLFYMDMDRDWTLKQDYTLTYTVSVDEKKPRASSADGVE